MPDALELAAARKDAANLARIQERWWRAQRRDLVTIAFGGAALWVAIEAAGNYGAIAREQWSDLVPTANLTDADAAVVVVAMLALVGSLTIATAAAAWRPQEGHDTDEAVIQLWLDGIRRIGLTSAAVALAVSATRVGRGGYWVTLLILAGLTAWLAVAAVQRTRDTAPLYVGLRFWLLKQDEQQRGVALLKAYLDQHARRWSILARVAGCFTAAAVPVAFGGLYLRAGAESPAQERGAAAFSVLCLGYVWLICGILWRSYLPRLSLRYSALCALAVTAVALLQVVWIGVGLWSVLRAAEPPGEVAAMLVMLIVGVGVFWILLYRGQTPNRVGSALFELEAQARHKRADSSAKKVEELHAELKSRTA